MVAYFSPPVRSFRKRLIRSMRRPIASGCSVDRQQRALQQRGQQRGADAFAGDIGHHRGPAVRADAGHIEVIAAHLVRSHAAAAGAEPAVGGQAARQQALLDGARHVQFFLDLLLGRALPRAGGHFPEWWRLRWPGSAAARDCRRPGRPPPGANPCRARRRSRRPVDSMLVASPLPVLMRTSGTQITLRSSRSAMLCSGRYSPVPCGSKFMESSSRRCSQGALDHAPGHAQIALAEASCPARLRATRVSRSPSLPQQQESALGAGDGQRGVHHGDQHVLRWRSRALQGARHFQNGAQLGQVAADAGPRDRPDFSCAPNCSIRRFSSAPSRAKMSW